MGHKSPLDIVIHQEWIDNQKLHIQLLQKVIPLSQISGNHNPFLEMGFLLDGLNSLTYYQNDLHLWQFAECHRWVLTHNHYMMSQDFL